ncbi:hypothetical protein QG083_08490 [Kingella kingae]|nr:hypothetical protein [Kingella kingae]MBD3614320.1 hypothetical protein [Kingella kingae]MBD3632569.1 hypothetical protein [Kingella kingae]MBD3659962.1 hypothetical protein [Kingella kingae]MDK4530474.1 hypothetical protein [Kingella kingae]MDK4535243.1 hypothetical protein [Kingella kingae]
MFAIVARNEKVQAAFYCTTAFQTYRNSPNAKYHIIASITPSSTFHEQSCAVANP